MNVGEEVLLPSPGLDTSGSDGQFILCWRGAQSFTRQNKSSAWSRGGRWGSPHGPAWS